MFALNFLKPGSTLLIRLIPHRKHCVFIIHNKNIMVHRLTANHTKPITKILECGKLFQNLFLVTIVEI